MRRHVIVSLCTSFNTTESHMQIKPQNNNSEVYKSTTDLNRVIKDVLELAKKEGATDAAVAVNYDRGFSVDVRMGEVETVAFSEDKGVGLTVYIGQRKGGASSTDTSPEALQSLVKAACEIAKVSAEDPCFGLADKELMTKNHPDLDLYHSWDITPQQAIDLALKCESHALSLDKRITNSDGVNVSSYESHHGYANTHGGEGFIHSTRHSVSCSVIAKEGDEMQRDYDYTTARNAENLVSADLIAAKAVERALSRLGSKQIKTQMTPVIFSSRVSSGLLGSFVSAISGSNLYRKNSFLLDSIGQQLFPEFVHIYEQPHLKGALGSAPFDGEGVPTRPNVLVEKGRLLQYVLGSYSARKMGLKTTANSDGVHNLTIDPTCGDLGDLLKMMRKGLLVTELMGQGVNGITGDYSRGASGYWVEDGVIQYPVDQITIAGNLKEMYRMILAIGSDINPNISMRCGSILIENMMVAGK
ncbi:TPA: metalloprotease PmbA [Legionella pneumophila]|nr:metalloprotease PmbA [Legionella pneumophila]HAT8815294.1 metalloprotease PmbA [Legionella pneumophila subsp. pneumophila]HAT6807398.1 metalloprotease PmbA [Legionella pneumophila]HAT6816765.1 metalloprotease PmbA [Legionella pneumophila]HAT6826365.1 metalloprotease PmbA [Legionella pneumophila]